MGKIAFLFAGQGAQAPGMGESLRAASTAAAKVFGNADILRPGTKDDCFFSTPARLAETDVTQPCVFAVDMAAAEALAAKGVTPDGVAGFSLGEVAALCFAGAFPFDDAFRLVCLRGQLMRAAQEENPGSMAAVMKLPDAAVEDLCKQFKQVYPVNYNCEGQLVVAGQVDEMPAFCDAVKAAGGMARPLAVGGAFHSPFMEAASEKFHAALHDTGMATPRISVYANLTAAPYAHPYDNTLADQMKSPVRWRATIENMAADGYDTFIEVGPGKTLTGLAKRIVPDATLANVSDADSLAATLALLG